MHLHFRIGLLFFFATLQATAQCPGSTATWDKIEALKNAALAADQQIGELLQWQKKCLACNATADSGYVRLLQRLGALYYLNNDFQRAIQYSEESIKVGSQKNSRTNPQHLVQSYYNLANSYKENKQFAQSIDAFKTCIAYADNRADSLQYKGLCYFNLANAFLKLGDYRQAILHAEKGEVLARRTGDNFSEALCLSEHAQALTESKQTTEAAATIRKAIAIMQNESSLNKTDNSLREELANMYIVYARTLAAAEEPQQAIGYYQKALRLFQQTGFRYGCFSTLNNIGYTFTEKLANNKAAKLQYDQAITYAVSSEDTVLYLNNLAALLYKEKKFEDALAHLQKALLLMPVNFSNPDPVSNPAEKTLFTCANKVLMLTLLTGKGETWLAYYHVSNQRRHLQLALQTYLLADKVVDMMRYEQQFSESKLFWRSETHQLYENAIEICYLLNEPANAFYFFEKSKAVLLSDQLHEQDWMVKKSRPLLYKQLQLKTNLAKWKRELETIPENNGRRDELINTIFRGEEELNQLLINLKKENPYYFRNYLDSTLLTLAFLQKNILQKQQSLVELFAGDSAVYSFYITPTQTRLQKIDKKNFDSTVTRFNTLIANEGLLNQYFPTFESTAQRLYNLVFGNVYLPPGRMIVSPDGQYFPFEALVKKKAGNTLTYFLNDHAVSYAYSARYLTNNNDSDNKNTSSTFLGIAPIRYASGWHLSALEKSDESLARIAKLFGHTTTFLYNEASRRNFSEGLYNHDIVQLYTHATDSGSNGEPVIYFADSLLYLSDLIAGDKPATQLIVLSACETASGQSFTGEGIFSFSRGFAALGIPASVTNLWRVDNEATYRLTELFYKYLADGQPADVALQKAKLNYMASASLRRQSPYYWAAMIHMGKENITIKKPRRWWPWAIGGLAVLAIIGVRLFGKRRKVFPTGQSEQ